VRGIRQSDPNNTRDLEIPNHTTIAVLQCHVHHLTSRRRHSNMETSSADFSVYHRHFRRRRIHSTALLVYVAALSATPFANICEYYF
jgi:hypothetical protein